MAAASAASAPPLRTLFALDFDGVVCNSVGESAETGVRAAARLWPEVFANLTQDRRAAVLEDMHKVRPVVETGYENLVQARLLAEGTATADDILDNWHTLLPACMNEWHAERSVLVKAFGDERDAWMKADLQGWLAPNTLYDGVADVLRGLEADASVELRVVTTKDARFTAALLHNLAGVSLPMERIHSQTASGRPKTEVLRVLQGLHPGVGRKVFVEDKLSALRQAEADAELDGWELWFASWGFCTQTDVDAVARAEQNGARVRVLRLEQVATVLR